MVPGLQRALSLVACAFIAGVAFYYLVWKYIVGSLNALLGLA